MRKMLAGELAKRLRNEKFASVQIYMLTDPTGAATCYVGASVNPAKRLVSHLSDRMPGRKSRWLQGLLDQGLLPHIVMLASVTEREAPHAEQDIIAMMRCLRGESCLNVSRGGYSPRLRMRRGK
jgi:hypothetical protein